MMQEHVNFYENIKEARMRLRGTIVLYEGVPYRVLAIADHKGPVFRIYLNPVSALNAEGVPYPGALLDSFPHDHPEFGKQFDKWLVDHPLNRIIRKRMDSKHFNSFRPFPLGMCNYGEKAYYVERQPLRKSEQGLTPASTVEHVVTAGLRADSPRSMGAVSIWNSQFADCILGKYPSAQDCLTNLIDPGIANEAVAFGREFALCRGPIDMLFLAYKTDIIGVLPNMDFSQVRIGKKFSHTREVVSELNLFQNII